MNAPELLAELNGRGVRLTSHGDRLAYDAPAGVMTPDLAERVKACKAELLAILAGSPEPVDGGQLETHADRETRRFLAVCRPWPDGCGWYDPAQAPTAEALARAEDRLAREPLNMKGTDNDHRRTN